MHGTLFFGDRLLSFLWLIILFWSSFGRLAWVFRVFTIELSDLFFAASCRLNNRQCVFSTFHFINQLHLQLGMVGSAQKHFIGRFVYIYLHIGFRFRWLALMLGHFKARSRFWELVHAIVALCYDKTCLWVYLLNWLRDEFVRVLGLGSLWWTLKHGFIWNKHTSNLALHLGKVTEVFEFIR